LQLVVCKELYLLGFLMVVGLLYLNKGRQFLNIFPLGLQLIIDGINDPRSMLELNAFRGDQIHHSNLYLIDFVRNADHSLILLSRQVVQLVSDFPQKAKRFASDYFRPLLTME
jgi:hypothetical protein